VKVIRAALGGYRAGSPLRDSDFVDPMHDVSTGRSSGSCAIPCASHGAARWWTSLV